MSNRLDLILNLQDSTITSNMHKITNTIADSLSDKKQHKLQKIPIKSINLTLIAS